MILDYFLQNFWPCAVLTAVLLISDYYLSLWQSKLYHSGAKEVVTIDGGIELNPQWQKDINKITKLNIRHILQVILFIIILWLVWTLAKMGPDMKPFEFVFGSIVLVQLFIHLRHIKGLYLYSSIVKKSGVSGHINYSRPFAHKSAAVDATAFGIMCLILAALTSRFLFLGGALTCAVIALSQRKWLKKTTERLNSESSGQ